MCKFRWLGSYGAEALLPGRRFDIHCDELHRATINSYFSIGDLAWLQRDEYWLGTRLPEHDDRTGMR